MPRRFHVAWALCFAFCFRLGAEEKTAPATLVDLSEVIPGLAIDLRYATADNFFKAKFYPDNARALLRPATAQKLALVEADLRRQGLGLKVLDAFRPLAVQRALWKMMPNPKYVADPAKGSRHNRGAAVDVTLVDATGQELSMPTPFDDFSEKAGAYFPHLPAEALKNREILQTAMTRRGFVILKSEWWHFDDEDWRNYPVLDVPLAANPPKDLPRNPTKFLAFDPRLVQHRENVKTVLGRAVKWHRHPVLAAEHPWEPSAKNCYPSVWWDAEKQRFHLWYPGSMADAAGIPKANDPDTVQAPRWCLVHATSTDGFSWERPTAAAPLVEGAAVSSIVVEHRPHSGNFKDSPHSDPPQRYKMVTVSAPGKAQARFSADGVRWGEPHTVEGCAKLEVGFNSVLWDEKLEKYLWFAQAAADEPAMILLESADFLHWKEAALNLPLAPEDGGDARIVGLTPFRYGAAWLTFVMLQRPSKGSGIDCELAWSTDALQWQRIMPGNPFLPQASKTEPNGAVVCSMAGPPILQDGSLLVYSSATSAAHPTQSNSQRGPLLSLAKIPLDRFVGWAPDKANAPSYLTTNPMKLTAPLRISADAAGGRVRAFLIDDAKNILATAQPITANVTDAPLQWEAAAPKEGDSVQLRLELENATLWALSGLTPLTP